MSTLFDYFIYVLYTIKNKGFFINQSKNMNTSLEEQLTEIGFSKNEIIVYLAVLKLGESTIGSIETATELHKQIIYNTARRLQEKNLLSIKEMRGKRYFSIDNPRALENFAEYRLDMAKKIIPDLFQMANLSHRSESVRIYKQQKGVRHYYLESIEREPKKGLIKILGVDSVRYFEIFKKDDMPFQIFERKRIELGVKIHLLLFGAMNEEIILNQERRLLELRLLKENIVTPMDIIIWHDHIGMLFYSAEPYVLDIVGKEVVDGFSNYLETLWVRGEKAL